MLTQKVSSDTKIPMRVPVVYAPKCPFCDEPIEPPKEVPSARILEFPRNVCKNCGAVYVYDPTGHNLGAAYVEALVFACDDDWDLAWQLLPEEDYLERRIEHYDGVTHQVIQGDFYQDRKVRGVLLFIRLQDDIQEVTHEGVKRKISTLPSESIPKRSAKFSKKLVEELVRENNLEELITLAKEDTRVIPALQRLLYTGDEKFRWQAIKALGIVSKIIIKIKPTIVTKFLRNIIYARSDSAASSWGAIGATAEVISNNPELYKNFIPPFVSFLIDQDSRKEVLWGIGRVAEKGRPDLVKRVIPALYKLVTDEDPDIRGHAAWCLGIFKEKPAKPLLEDLVEDHHVIQIFIEGELKEKTVSELAKKAIQQIENA